MLCSVCIANYNGREYIEKCIESVLTQEGFPGEYEIIIHDDASKDDSVEYISSKYPDVQLLQSEENVGFCTSNNRMVSISKGEFILLLNNDATLCQDSLKTLYEASVVHGPGIYGLPQYDAANNQLIDMGSIFDPFLNPMPNRDSEKRDVGMVTGACLWMPRNLWDSLGGFPEWFGSLGEDLYICVAARLRGVPVQIIASSRFSHWVGKNIGGGKIIHDKLSTTLTRRAKSERNKTFVMLICYPFAMAAFLLPVHLFFLVIEGALLAIIKRDKRIWQQIYWYCLKEVWIQRGLWLRQRQFVQGVRSCGMFSFLSVFTWVPHKLRMLVAYGVPEIR